MAKHVPACLEFHQAHRVLATRWLSHSQEFSRRDRAYFGHRHDYNYDIVQGRVKPAIRLIVASTKNGVPH